MSCNFIYFDASTSIRKSSRLDTNNQHRCHLLLDMMDRAELEHYRILSFPIYYGRLLLNTWKLNSVQLLVSIIGTGVVLTVIARFGRFLWSYLLRPSSLPRYCHSETGSWALITGASDGIGRGFADELLSNGFNVLIHGRNEEKLQGIQKGMKLRWPRRGVEYVVADASETNAELRVVEKVKTLPGRLTVLVNNVGGEAPTSNRDAPRLLLMTAVQGFRSSQSSRRSRTRRKRLSISV